MNKKTNSESNPPKNWAAIPPRTKSITNELACILASSG